MEHPPPLSSDHLVTPSTGNLTTIVETVQLVSSTKDSVHLRWKIDHDLIDHIKGYQISYQAKDSTIKQLSTTIDAHQLDYELKELHENTKYDFCVKVLSNLTSFIKVPCLEISTAVDSFSVALGSTFGAFLALGVIVFFVMVAKWQHTRKLQRQLASMAAAEAAASDEEEDGGITRQDGVEIELSDVTLQLHGDTGSLGTGSVGASPGRRRYSRNSSIIVRQVSCEYNSDSGEYVLTPLSTDTQNNTIKTFAQVNVTPPEYVPNGHGTRRQRLSRESSRQHSIDSITIPVHQRPLLVQSRQHSMDSRHHPLMDNRQASFDSRHQLLLDSRQPSMDSRYHPLLDSRQASMDSRTHPLIDPQDRRYAYQQRQPSADSRHTSDSAGSRQHSFDSRQLSPSPTPDLRQYSVDSPSPTGSGTPHGGVGNGNKEAVYGGARPKVKAGHDPIIAYPAAVYIDVPVVDSQNEEGSIKHNLSCNW